MKKEAVLSTSGKRYNEAYEKQYGIKDLHAALLAYKGIVSEFPDTKEASYSKSQIKNIAHHVVPEKELFEAQLNLALSYSKHNDTSDRQLVEATSSV